MKLEHVAMYVLDLESVKDFFVRYFNATAGEMYHNTKTDFKSYFLTFDGGSRLEIMTRPQLPDNGKSQLQCGLIHIAFSVGGKEKVDSLTKILSNDGYEVVSDPRTTGDGYYESCILGPENNLVEITE